jgi:hypothetical protein
MVENAMEYYGVSERKTCRVLGQCRATQRCEPKQIDDEELLRNSVTRLASKYGRYGYKRVTAPLNQDGWKVSVDRSVALVTLGAGDSLDTVNIKDPIVGFVFGQKGLTYNLTLEGSKYTKIAK